MRRLLSILAVASITAGLVMVANVALTLVWKEPASAIYTAIRQGEANDQLTELEEEFLDRTEVGRLIDSPDGNLRRLADAFETELRRGRPIGRIEAPTGGIDSVVVEGTDDESLRKGPGHYPETALPGQGETIGVAGHRTTYGAPFNEIDEIDTGDEIVVEMPYGTFTYEVERSRIVEPDQVGVVRDVGRERLVLTACHPLYSAAQRYVVFARLADASVATVAGRSP